MDAQRPAHPSDLDEHVDEVGACGEQFAELVDDDQQAGQRRQRHASGPRPLVVPLRGVVAGPAQQLLAPDQFARDRAVHPVHQGQFVGQVGDHRAGVRQAVQPGESGTTLEVDQDEVEDLGAVRDSQRQHQRA